MCEIFCVHLFALRQFWPLRSSTCLCLSVNAAWLMHGDGLADCSTALSSPLFHETSRVSQRSSPTSPLQGRWEGWRRLMGPWRRAGGVGGGDKLWLLALEWIILRQEIDRQNKRTVGWGESSVSSVSAATVAYEDSVTDDGSLSNREKKVHSQATGDGQRYVGKHVTHAAVLPDMWPALTQHNALASLQRTSIGGYGVTLKPLYRVENAAGERLRAKSTVMETLTVPTYFLLSLHYIFFEALVFPA